MPLTNTVTELVKYLAFRCSPTALKHHHKAFDNAARHYMESRILPTVSAQSGSRVMFVGCRSYTYHYRTYFLRSGIDYWTSDIDPVARIWGERRKHITCDVKLLGEHVLRQSFDLVILNGVFGYGVDDVASMDQAVSAVRCTLKDNAHLLVGWNKDRVADPERLPAIVAQFDRNVGLPLPFRKEFEDHSHVYDLFRARPITHSSASAVSARISSTASQAIQPDEFDTRSLI